MSEPRRIQLRRTKGWRLPEGTVNVARHSSGHGKWGNPFRVGHKVISPGRWGTEANPYPGDLAPGHYDGTSMVRAYDIRLVRDRADAVALFIAYYSKVAWCEPSHLERIRRELGGRDLACWCPPGEPCHGDALLAVANGRRPVTPDVPLPGGGSRIHVKRCCNGCGQSLGDVTDAEIAAAIDGRGLPDVRKECPRCSVILANSPFARNAEAVKWLRDTARDHLAQQGTPARWLPAAERVAARTLLIYLTRYLGPGTPGHTADIQARMTAAALMLDLPLPEETTNA